jgi:hypothetical protein
VLTGPYAFFRVNRYYSMERHMMRWLCRNVLGHDWHEGECRRCTDTLW